VTEFSVNFENSIYLKTAQTGAYSNRLNWRSELLLARNLEAIQNKKVLDIACHDGRFSYACLKLGAKHITGVEGRQPLVDSAEKNLEALGFPKDKYNFICGDIFDKLTDFEEGDFDTILCLGFFYHTIRQIELLQQIRRLNPKYLILDTTVFVESNAMKTVRNFSKRANWFFERFKINGVLRRLLGKTVNFSPLPPNNYLIFSKESHERGSNTIESHNVLAIPTESLVEKLLHVYDFKVSPILWKSNGIQDWRDIEDYRNNRRVSYIASL
jgi:ubiquinone/menaquinone biosynthesis C-methylase UbiE